MDNNVTDKLKITTYGTNDRLDTDSNNLSDIVKQTSAEIANKFGKRFADNNIVDYYTQLNLSSIFDNTKKDDNKKASPDALVSSDDYRQLMTDSSQSSIQLLAAESNRLLNYANYTSIAENIPECALARDTYVSNILSPDDYTKSIFFISYEGKNNNETEKVESGLKSIIEKYNIENKIQEVTSSVVTLGDCFVSVLPYDKELSRMIAATGAGLLTESPDYNILDETYHLTERTSCTTLNESTILEDLDPEENSVLVEAFGDNYATYLTNAVNNNVQMHSVTDLLKSKADADNDIIFSKADIEYDDDASSKKSKKSKVNLNINGAAIKILDPSKIVELEIDDVVYGFYYIEPGSQSGQPTYSAQNAKSYAMASNPANPSLMPQPSDNPGDAASIPAARNLNISDEKFELLSKVVLKALSKKLNKKYITENKQFKDLLYSLIKQKYIIEKGISITFLMPEEVVHFKTPSIFKDVVFFAKLYLATLTNTIIIKMGRGHDKRVFYINAGLDANHEQSILKVVQDIKTKEFKMSNLGSISSILNLNPGAFDDFYIPQVNGEKSVSIETLQGMDVAMDNDFLNYLRRSMIQGTGLPPSLLEAADNIEFAKQIASQNANLCRRIIRIQKDLTEPTLKLIRLLYKYENQYTMTSNISNAIDLSKIHLRYPSPNSLNNLTLAEAFTQADGLADYIAKTFEAERPDQSNIEDIAYLKGKIFQHLLPQIEWDEYEKIYESCKEENQKRALLNAAVQPPQDPNDMGQDGQNY